MPAPDFGTQPLNYSQDVATPFQSAMSGYSAGAAIRNDQQAQQQQQAAMQARQQQAQVLQSLISNPNAGAADYARATLLIPGLKDNFKQGFDMLNTAQQQAHLSDVSQWFAAVRNGQPQVAVDGMNEKAAAMQAAGMDPSKVQAMRVNARALEIHPELGRMTMGLMLAALPGGDKVIDAANAMDANQRQQALAPPTISKAYSDASKASSDAIVAGGTIPAQIAKPGLENSNISSQIATRAGQLALDQDKLSSEYGLKVAELRRKPGAIDLPDSALKIVNESAGNAVLARNSAAQLNDLASQFETADPNSFGASAWEFAKQATGQQDYVSALRKEYVRLRAGEVAKILPPGPASDTDIKNAMAGFPTETASASQVSSFLRGTAKLQAYNAQLEDAKSEWANAVGQLGKAPRDIEIGGISVPAGTTFTEFTRRTLKSVGAVTQRPAPAAGAKARLLQTYGGVANDPGPVPGTD